MSDKKAKKRNVKNVMCDVKFGECKFTKLTQLMGWGCGVCLLFFSLVSLVKCSAALYGEKIFCCVDH